ncbi:MAG: FAD-dependent oxidoreductase [Armatimonadota bacterium]
MEQKHLQTDIAVVGGGMAGVCCAIAAARSGAQVVLVHDRPMLGGNSSSEVRMHICGADCSGARNDTDARETGILEELRLEDTVHNPQRSASMWDILLYDRVRTEPNITLLLNTCCHGVRMASSSRIAALLASNHLSETEYTILAKIFVDCSGDGRLGKEAGAQFRTGREGRNEFGETLAPPRPDNKRLGSTILFITRQHNHPMPFVPPQWITRFPTCNHLPYRHHNSWEYGYWWVEFGGSLDTITDGDLIRDKLLAFALGVWDHIKNSGQHPQSANWALEWIGFLPGKRESRRFMGEYVLNQRDIERGELFEDGVAYGGWPIDLHPPEGILSKEPPAQQIHVPLYNIPLRCLYSSNVQNLFFAGRNISATHIAFGSTRVMGTCSVMGQAVGTAAALCVREGILPFELKPHITVLQQMLLKADAYIIGVTNSDKYDLARSAEVIASSETPEGKAINIINGVRRGVGAHSNRWISDPTKGLPQWIELRFREPVRIREVHLVFDTGLHRPLTLTHSNSYNARMIRGAQPETVRDYDLQVIHGTSTTTVATVRGNYQRLCRHRFAPHSATALKLVVHATNGDPSARLFEIRAYETEQSI